MTALRPAVPGVRAQFPGGLGLAAKVQVLRLAESLVPVVVKARHARSGEWDIPQRRSQRLRLWAPAEVTDPLRWCFPRRLQPPDPGAPPTWQLRIAGVWVVPVDTPFPGGLRPRRVTLSAGGFFAAQVLAPDPTELTDAQADAYLVLRADAASDMAAASLAVAAVDH